MCCGFGAVVLLVMLLNGKTLQKRSETQKNLKAEVERLTQLKEYANTHLDELQKKVETLALEEDNLSAKADQTRKKISEKQIQTKKSEQEANKQKKEIAAIKRKISSLEKVKKIQKTPKAQNSSKAKRVGFDGEGKRQYLTGLKLGGERTLILVDASASMLDETIVNIIRRKHMDKEVRRRSKKWLRVVRSVHWLVANLQPNKSFQVYYFNTKTQPVLEGTENQWLSSSKTKDLDRTIEAVRELAPEGGTNLMKAFDVINKMKPKPDNVLLLTDGLPTQENKYSTAKTISARKRLLLFNNAVRSLPAGVPINTFLFPLEGDPEAAAAFWELAILTRGSFMTPSRDWP